MRLHRHHADRPTGRPGRVVFVGAGPGAPDLITVRGAKTIQEADIVIWASSLVHPSIIAPARRDDLIVDSASATLEDLQPYFVRARDEGLMIARVHTGDPSIYGATAEQRALCDQLGLAHSTIPGVSAYSALAAAADVEITVPEVSQSFVLTRLEGGRTPMPRGETVRGFAAHGATMAIYLSAARHKQLQDALLEGKPEGSWGRVALVTDHRIIGEIVQGLAFLLPADFRLFKVADTLLEGGYPPDTPCIVGFRVSWEDQLLIRCPLSELSATMRERKLWKHTMVLVGPAVSEGPVAARSHLYHPGFRHGYRAAEPGVRAGLRAWGAVGIGQVEDDEGDDE